MIKVQKGDITKLAVDAIVNAANPTLLGGAGVDGAIHNGAGPELREECATLGGCAMGEAKITKGYNLPAKFVIHTVGPIWYGGDNQEDESLAECYVNSLTIAVENDVKTIAFPAISTGAFAFPIERATRIAFDEVMMFCVREEAPFDEIIFVCFEQDVYNTYNKAYEEL